MKKVNKRFGSEKKDFIDFNFSVRIGCSWNITITLLTFPKSSILRAVVMFGQELQKLICSIVQRIGEWGVRRHEACGFNIQDRKSSRDQKEQLKKRKWIHF